MVSSMHVMAVELRVEKTKCAPSRTAACSLSVTSLRRFSRWCCSANSHSFVSLSLSFSVSTPRTNSPAKWRYSGISAAPRHGFPARAAPAAPGGRVSHTARAAWSQ